MNERAGSDFGPERRASVGVPSRQRDGRADGRRRMEGWRGAEAKNREEEERRRVFEAR